jgi:cell division septation protein DedD
VAAATTQQADDGTVARGDWLVVRVDATGLNGLLPEDLPNDNGVDVSFVQAERGMNVEPNDFNVSSPSFSFSDGERIVATPDREGFYLFVDIAEHGIAAGDRYDVSFSVAADGPLADEREAVSVGVRVVERRVDLRYDGDRIVFENRTTLRANTTLAPGTTVNVTATDDDLPPIHEPRTKTVGPDRTFAATFDFSDYRSGRELEVALRDQGQTHEAVVGPLAPETTVAPTTTDPVTETTATTTTVEPTTTDPATTATAAATTTSEPTATTTAESTAVGLTQVSNADTPPGESGPLTQRTVVQGSSGVADVPGFDAASLVVAVLAAAVLAARRS